MIDYEKESMTMLNAIISRIASAASKEEVDCWFSIHYGFLRYLANLWEKEKL